MRKIKFISDDIGFAWNEGYVGSVYKTTDGGLSWTLWSGTYSNGGTVNDMDVVSEDEAWVCGRRMSLYNWIGFISRTTDGGQTWHEEDTHISPYQYAIAFADKDNGWSGGWGGSILKYGIPPVHMGAIPISSILLPGWSFNAGYADQYLLNKIRGTITSNTNDDCLFNDSTEKVLSGRIVQLLPSNQFALTNNNGSYEIMTSQTGIMEVTQVQSLIPGIQSTQYCPPLDSGHIVNFTFTNQVSDSNDFINEELSCPLLSVEVTSGEKEPCTSGITVIKYCNYGAVAADSVSIAYSAPSYSIITSSSHTYSYDPQSSSYTFFIGEVPAGDCGYIQVLDSIYCDPSLSGENMCVWADISPKPSCPSTNYGWDGSDLEVQAYCINNADTARLSIYNLGDVMSDSTAIRIYFDSVQVYQSSIWIPSQDSLVYRMLIPDTVLSVLVEVDQSLFHPYKSKSSILLSSCSSSNTAATSSSAFSTGYTEDYYCTILLSDSTTPSQPVARMSAWPTGRTSQGLIPLQTDLSYNIHFNTSGKQLVFTDTLPDELDVSTLRFTGSSHQYEYNVSGTGKPVVVIGIKSQRGDTLGAGFVSYSVKPKENIQEGQVIDNKVNWYIDDHPVQSGRVVRHTIDQVLVPDKQNIALVPERPYIYLPPDTVNTLSEAKTTYYSINPNPNRGLFRLRLKNASTSDVQIYDQLGRRVATFVMSAKVNNLDLRYLPKGIYFLRVTNQQNNDNKSLKFIIE